MKYTIFLLVFLCAQNAFCQNSIVVEFEKVQLSSTYLSEGGAIGDLNNDSIMDLVEGPYWYQGPDYAASRKEIYTPYTLGNYADEFFSHIVDINKDGWQDVLVISFPGVAPVWYENPKGVDKHWTKHNTGLVVDHENPAVLDLNGDGNINIVCTNGGILGWTEYDPTDLSKNWVFNPVSVNNNYHKFNHGLGVGDVDKDGKLDFILKEGWWKQPVNIKDNHWGNYQHPFHGNRAAGEPAGGGEMYVYDVDGDGDNDVITVLQGHGWDLAWFENMDSVGSNFTKHMIMGMPDEIATYGAAFPQMHALRLEDINGDGLKDLVTGKRIGTHGPSGDPVVYWFELTRNNGQVKYIPHEIDNGAGIGAGLTSGDVNGDGQPDIFIGNKNGAFLITQKTRASSVRNRLLGKLLGQDYKILKNNQVQMVHENSTYNVMGIKIKSLESALPIISSE